MRGSAEAGTIANVSISGPSARSGRHQLGAARLVALVDAVDHDDASAPRRNSGTSGSGGICMMRADVVTVSGAVSAHAR